MPQLVTPLKRHFYFRAAVHRRCQRLRERSGILTSRGKQVQRLWKRSGILTSLGKKVQRLRKRSGILTSLGKKVQRLRKRSGVLTSLGKRQDNVEAYKNEFRLDSNDLGYLCWRKQDGRLWREKGNNK